MNDGFDIAERRLEAWAKQYPREKVTFRRLPLSRFSREQVETMLAYMLKRQQDDLGVDLCDMMEGTDRIREAAHQLLAGCLAARNYLTSEKTIGPLWALHQIETAITAAQPKETP